MNRTKTLAAFLAITVLLSLPAKIHAQTLEYYVPEDDSWTEDTDIDGDYDLLINERNITHLGSLGICLNW